MTTATKDQKLAIRRNVGYDIGVKEEYVQWATNDNAKTSLNDLSFDQANQILIKQGEKPHTGENWAYFDALNPKHKKILSLMRELQWTKPHPVHHEVPNMLLLSDFLKSDKSPVKKPLKEMIDNELSKIIKALQRIILTTKYKV
ncbi:hypothetical protein [Flavobacterium kingsejongi]|uniref:Uncharacterized protein n=1 Tax=Flavobacterium kingsejongi TaxID=1678728 RepID=A0A2S1LM69_9FLAO|nr:hypothetical protein [Flavobacterium kingsejongi]AWG24809.1 hypothetical protein FK004_05990 [Flavobacterium kingsejongi]AWG25045.1 hypothetical protein FK004_07265 [Flavobacterium kingsejongi]